MKFTPNHMKFTGLVGGSGKVDVRIVRPDREVRNTLSMRDMRRLGYPQRGLSRIVNEWREENWSRHLRDAVYRLKAATTLHGIIGGDVRAFSGLYLARVVHGARFEWLGLASVRVVTTAGVNYIVDAFQDSVEVESFKYHGIGTGTNGESSSDSALQTELTTEYNPNNTRATGSQTEGASANIYRTVGTNTVDSAVAITEHGIFTSATSGAGTLLDRSTFSAVNLASGDSIQSTYDLTFTAGG